MELHNAQVETLENRVVPWAEGEALIAPLGDIQFMLPPLDDNGKYVEEQQECHVELLKAHIARVLEHPNPWFIGMGDYVDFGSPSNRGRLKALMDAGELYDGAETAIDQAAQMNLDALEEVLEPTKGRWLGLLEGHHFWTYSNGDTSDTRLAKFLGCPYLGTCAMVRVQFSQRSVNDNKRNPANLIIWGHHGRGGGLLQSSPLNKMEHVVKAFDADVYLLGHHHKQVGAKMQRIVPQFSARKVSRHRLHHKDILITGTGGWLRGYLRGSKRHGRASGTYVEAGMMNPVALGGVKILVHLIGKRDGYTELETELIL